MAKQETVISHWHQLIENFHASPVGFYNDLERAIKNREVPELQHSRVDYKEGGLLTANREYIRIVRGKNAFDICAAPFGTGFFFSWWFVELPATHGLLYLLALGFATLMAELIAFQIGFMFLVFFTLFGVPIILWIVGKSIRDGGLGIEDTVLAMPIIGWLYEKIFQPPTYYKTDTALMFQDAVHNAVVEVVNELTAGKGIRGLTELERKPILKGRAQSA